MQRLGELRKANHNVYSITKLFLIGQHFLSGTTLGLELVNDIRKQTQVLAEYTNQVAGKTDYNSIRIMNDMEEIGKRLWAEKDNRDTLFVNSDYSLPFAGNSEEFINLLATGTYESFENRVFLCGSCACGKSTLASVLIGSPIPLTWKSTDGLVIHFGRNDDRGQNVWTKVVIGKPNRETSDKLIASSSSLGTDCLESSDDKIGKSEDLPDTNIITSKTEKGSYISLPKHGGTFVVMFDGSRDFHEPLKEYPTGDISNEYADFKEFVVQVLTHLDILVLPKRYSGNCDTHVDYYLVPCTIKNKMPMSFLDDKSFANRTLSLVYRLKMSSIPSALSLKLIGAVSSIWPIMQLNGRPSLYHSSAVLCVDGKTEFRIIAGDTKVIVFLTHKSCKSSISPDIAASIQECLTSTLEVVLKCYLSINGKSHQKANVSDLFEIEIGEVCSRSPCVVSISQAKLNSYWVCNSGNEHFSKYPLIWFFDKTQKECPSTCPGLETTRLTASPCEKQLSRLADQLDNNSCRELMLHLGFTTEGLERY
ncbi:unnamed protein product [Mytilus edulis]|uniref:Uncharacterized protein n=1 Tax=Mytilus edulis TaxID=6550 RepID=A0A8S3S146_MYTED|nr:unnamed protein product [Mytilus edulis]